MLLPIDAKFPLEDYERLQQASQEGDKELVDKCAQALERSVLTEAKRIAGKYIRPPYTTDFAVLFLPTEGLYAEALRRPGLAQRAQREYHILLAGPTTLSALLTSLQTGFRTLAVEQRSREIWRLLGSVRAEFTSSANCWTAPASAWPRPAPSWTPPPPAPAASPGAEQDRYPAPARRPPWKRPPPAPSDAAPNPRRKSPEAPPPKAAALQGEKKRARRRAGLIRAERARRRSRAHKNGKLLVVHAVHVLDQVHDLVAVAPLVVWKPPSRRYR